MIAFIPTPSQLREALGHVYYEIEQLLHASTISTSDVGINNALLESSLVHVRALLDFFEKSARSKRKNVELDDVLSIDYGFPSQTVPIGEIYKDRLNKDLAHLTYSRTERSLPDKYWPPHQIYPPMLECIEEFIEHLIHKFLPSNDSSAIPAWQDLKSKVAGRRAEFSTPNNALQPMAQTAGRG